MHKRKKPSTRNLLERAVPRRTALKGLGALAVSLPVLGSAACSEHKKTASTTAPPALAGNGSGGAGAGGSLGGAPGQTASANGAGSAPSGAAGASPNPTVGPTGTGGNGTQTAGTGGGAATGTGGAGGNPAVGTGGASAPNASSDFVPVMFDNVASCTLTPTDPAGEGPFFVHEDEVMTDESLIRSDMREGKAGVELQLNLRVLDSNGGCMTPIGGVEVYVWHTDATGYYSGFANQNPDMPYSGGIERTVENDDRFCRGVQVTDKDGVVRFRTLYPGWYNGRAIHIHFVALRPGSGPATTSYRSTQYMVFTTQMYFEEQFSRMIHEHNAPYTTRTMAAAYATYVKPQNTVVMPTMKMQGNVAVGALNVVTAAMGSRR